MMDAYRSEVDYLQEIGARLEINGSTGEPTARPVLDAGEFGLEFFRAFGPAYAAVTGGARDVDPRHYDAHREIDYGRLRADARRHQEVAMALGERMLDIRNGASPVFEAWHGAAAGQAKGRFDTFLTRGESLRAAIAGLGSVLTESVDAADRAVYEKAVAVADLWTDQVDTLTAPDVDFMVGFCRRCGATTPGPLVDDDELERVAGLRGLAISPAQCRTNPVAFKQVVTAVRSWLKSVFVPFYQARAEAFDAACTTADTKVDEAWAAATKALGDVPTDPFGGVVAAQPPSDQAAAPTSAMSDGPLPETPADRAGGITSALGGAVTDGAVTDGVATDGVAADGAGTDGTAADPVVVSDNTMHPAAGALPQPVAAPAAPIAPSTPSGGQQGNTFFGAPFFGGGGNRGGGNGEHRSAVPLAGLSTEGLTPDHGGHTIGAGDDPTVYNEDADQAVEATKSKKSLLDELLDAESLW